MNIKQIDRELVRIMEDINKLQKIFDMQGNSDISMDLHRANESLMWAYHLLTRQYA